MKKILIIISIILMCIIISAVIFFIVIKPDVTLNDNLKVEINSSIKTNDFIKDIKHGSIISKSKEVDTTKLGIQEVIIEIKSYLKKVNYKFEIEIIDTKKPVIEGLIELKTNINKEIDLLNSVSVSDNSNEKLEVSVVGDYDFNKAGVYELKYYAKDSSGNEVYKDFVLSVLATPKSNYKTSKTSNGYTVITKDGLTAINGIIIANKSYSLPKNYGNGLTTECLNAFNQMKSGASKEGLALTIVSGFRSYNTQVSTYNKWVQQDGKATADTYSARPGHSEHQTGLAMDLNLISTSFENTKEFKWLNENAYKYGFILRYPSGKDDITGYIYEPWHYRYVGVELAEKLYNNGSWITIEEYFGIDSVYK